MEKIKELREKTGAGMMDCKKALEEAGGDMEKAVEILRKKGIAKANKREDRDTSEGIIKVEASDDAKTAFAIEFRTETDFVAKNEKFQDYTNAVMELVKTNKPASVEDLFAIAMEDGTVKENLDNLSGVIGEKLDIANMQVVESEGSVAVYSHMNGRIGVIVSLDKADQKDLAYDIAMHVAAADPKYLAPEEVPSEETDKEKEIYKEQLLKEGKPENIIDKILEGKINKYYEGVCLLKQEFIKDDKKKVEQVLGDAKIDKFIRLSL